MAGGASGSGDEEEDENGVYCICRSSDTSRFMIGCDNCNEWYHGDCISITEQFAKDVSKFFCLLCRTDNPSLKTIFKSDRKACGQCSACTRSEDCGKCETCVENVGKKCRKRVCKVERKRKEEKREKRRREEPQEEDDDDDGGAKDKEIERLRAEELEKERRRKETERRKKERERELQLKRERELQLKRERELQLKRERERELQLKRERERELQLKREAEQKLRQQRELEEQRQREALEQERKLLLLQQQEQERLQQQQLQQLQQQQQQQNNNNQRRGHRDRHLHDDEYVPDNGGAVGRNTTKRGTAPASRKQPRQEQVSTRRLRRRIDDDLWHDRGANQEEAKQCFGPRCAQVARPNSKYCSDECGMKLAMSRIFEILPTRIQSWQKRTAEAELANERNLQKIREQIRDAHLEELEYRRKKAELEELIRRAKESTITEEDVEESEDQEQVYCVTCGHEFPTRTVIRHMERCFNRYESQTSYGSAYPTKGDLAEMFCEFHIPSQQSYCKRLKILCPEHYKEPKVLDTEVCGFPIQKELFNEENIDFCRLPKKKCIKHISWERMKRAQVDMEIIRARLKREELCEQERIEQIQMASRGGVLGLMLHNTIEHVDDQSPPLADNSSQSYDVARSGAHHKAITNHARFRDIREGPGSPSGTYRGDHDYGFRPT